MDSNDYFPYGKLLREFNPQGERYLTTQHERDQETEVDGYQGTGLDNRGARFYDSDVARFLSLDPHATDYLAWSAYHYVLANPITYIDPDGRNAWKPEVDELGNPTYVAEEGDDINTFVEQFDVSMDEAQKLFEQNNIKGVGYNELAKQYLLEIE